MSKSREGVGVQDQPSICELLFLNMRGENVQVQRGCGGTGSTKHLRVTFSEHERRECPSPEGLWGYRINQAFASDYSRVLYRAVMVHFL